MEPGELFEERTDDREALQERIRFLETKLEQYEYVNNSLSRQVQQLVEVNRLLKIQLDEARQLSIPEQHTPVCRQCGKPLRHGNKGRLPDYCSNSCRQKAYRARKTASVTK